VARIENHKITNVHVILSYVWGIKRSYIEYTSTGIYHTLM